MRQSKTFPPQLVARAAKIKLLLMDCDGVLTDGRIYFVPASSGDLTETKTFHSQDGIAFEWARSAGIDTGIISGRSSPAVEERARTAHMRYLYQGNTTKLPLFEKILANSGLAADHVGYVGDDITDLPIMRRAGLAAAPADSRPEALDAAHFVASSPGGRGAVRDVIELLLVAQNRWPEILAKYDI